MFQVNGWDLTYIHKLQQWSSLSPKAIIHVSRLNMEGYRTTDQTAENEVIVQVKPRFIYQLIVESKSNYNSRNGNDTGNHDIDALMLVAHGVFAGCRGHVHRRCSLIST